MVGLLLIISLYGAISPKPILNANLEYYDQNICICLRNIIKNKGIKMTVITNPEIEVNTFDLDSTIFRTDLNHLHLLKHLESFSVNFMMEVESLSNFNRTLQIVRNFVGHTKSFYIFIISEKNKTNLLTIYGLIWNFKIRNFLLLVKDNIEAELYVLDLSNSECGTKIFPRLLSTCDGKIKMNSLTLQENFYKYFIGCPFRVIWSPSPPWILTINQSYPGGVLIEILNIFKQTSHLDLIYMPENLAYINEVQNNYGFESLLRDFNRGYADVYAGLSSYFGSVPVEKTFITDNNLYFAMPKPIQVPYWKTFLMIFSWRYCLIMCAILILISLVITSLSANEQRLNSFAINLLNSFAVSLGMGVHKLPSSMKLKMFLCKYFNILNY